MVLLASLVPAVAAGGRPSCQAPHEALCPDRPRVTVETGPAVTPIGSPSADGPVVAYQGLVLLEIKETVYATTHGAGRSSPCDPWRPVQHVNCYVRTAHPVHAPVVQDPVGCLHEATVGIDADGDGTDEVDAPVLAVRPEPC